MQNFLSIIASADLKLNLWLIASRNPFLVKVFKIVTYLGEVKLVAILIVLVILYLWYQKKKDYILPFLVTIVGSTAVSGLAKIVFHRARPLNAVYLESSYSMPSGHATIAVAFYGFVVYYLWMNIQSKIVKNIILIVSIILMLAIGFSRLYLGVHYLSDVLVGYLLGGLSLWVGVVLKNRK